MSTPLRTQPFVPPPYPFDRIAALQRLAQTLPGGMVDASAGQPVDPVPSFILEALRSEPETANRYPAANGSDAYREAVTAWFARRYAIDVDPTAVVACVGTKEFIASVPHLLHLRDPERDTVLYPAISYPTYEMGARLAGLRAVPVPLTADWHLDLSAVSPDDARRELLLWVNEPANPTGASASAAQLAAVVEWGRAHGIIVGSDECYAEFTYDAVGDLAPPRTALAQGPSGVLAVHSLSKRSNLAGLRVGFALGDPDLVTYLSEVRRHAGLMTPAPIQRAAIAALGDETHVAEQRARYETRRATLLPALEAVGLVHDGGPSTFFLWVRDIEAVDDGWEIAARLAECGLLVVPGDLYGGAGADHVRISLTIPDDRVALAAQRLSETSERR
jgi:succinyldiaminopimelate transaminase